MQQSKDFVQGIRVFAPKGNTPEFIKFSGIINKKELTEFMKGRGDEVRFQVKESRQGGFYVEVDTWEPSK